MAKYKKYRDSGVKWLGDIPNDWKIVDFRRCTSLSQGLQIPQEQRFYEDGENRYLYLTIKYLNSEKNDIDKEFIENPNKNVICEKDDVLLARTGATGVVITDVEGVYHNNFFKIKYDKNRLVKKYLVYYLSQSGIQEHFKLVAGTTTIPDLNHGEFLSTKVIIPPMDVQNHIVKFLVQKTSEIDSLIFDKEKLITLLEEKRKSIITEAISKGLNPDVKMKDSGVEWIGEIPKHWRLKKLKYNCYMKGRIGWQGLKQSEFIDEGPYLITGMNFKEGKINWEEVYHISEERYNEAPEIQLKVGDVLITKDGTIGKLLYIDYLPDKTSLNSHLLVMRPKKKDFIPKYLYYSLSAEYFKKYVEQVKTGTTFFGITQEAIGEFLLILPSIEEQMEIVKVIEKNIQEIDETKELILRQVSKLKEYRQSLISEAVTGKIDVRDYCKEA